MMNMISVPKKHFLFNILVNVNRTRSKPGKISKKRFHQQKRYFYLHCVHK